MLWQPLVFGFMQCRVCNCDVVLLLLWYWYRVSACTADLLKFSHLLPHVVNCRRFCFWRRQSVVFCLCMKYLRTGPACVVQWSYHLGAMSSRVWCAQCAAGPAFKSSRGLVRCVRLRKSNYLKIMPMHMMIREIIPRQATEGSTVSSVKCDRCWHLD